MVNIVKQAIELSQEVLDFPLQKCGPSDDIDKQYAYAASFRDLSVRFVTVLSRLNDPEIEKILGKSDGYIDTNYIVEAHQLRSKFLAVADYLHEIENDDEYLEKVRSGDIFVEDEIVAQLRVARNVNFDLRKLIRLVEELNDAYRSGNYISSILILRAVMNHIPPIFGQTTFSQIVAQSNRSTKAILSKLEDDARPIADMHTHMTIRKNEYLPTKSQVEPYKSSFEVLLLEVLSKVSSA